MLDAVWQKRARAWTPRASGIIRPTTPAGFEIEGTNDIIVSTLSHPYAGKIEKNCKNWVTKVQEIIIKHTQLRHDCQRHPSSTESSPSDPEKIPNTNYTLDSRP